MMHVAHYRWKALRLFSQSLQTECRTLGSLSSRFSPFRLFFVRIVSLCSRLSFTWSSQSAYHWTRKSFVLYITAILKLKKMKSEKNVLHRFRITCFDEIQVHVNDIISVISPFKIYM